MAGCSSLMPVYIERPLQLYCENTEAQDGDVTPVASGNQLKGTYRRCRKYGHRGENCCDNEAKGGNGSHHKTCQGMCHYCGKHIHHEDEYHKKVKDPEEKYKLAISKVDKE